MAPSCPCCGQDWPSALSLDTKTAKRLAAELVLHTSTQRRVMGCLIARFGEFVPRVELIDAAYSDDPAGGPDNASNVIAVVVNQLRKKVGPFGLQIEGRPYYGSRLKQLPSEGT